jgi:NADPH:quinone reductase-like Zn-dependent oxidoreductase
LVLGEGQNTEEVSLLGAGIRCWGAAVERFEMAEPRALRDGEVLIEVKAAGVGNWDEVARKGEWNLGHRPPIALGLEAAGVVSALGPGVERWLVGDQVLTHPLPLVDQGTWAPWLIARGELLARKPIGVSWSRAGAFAVPALTAIQVLDETLHVMPGETLLVNGGGSVTGGLLVSLAGLRGATAIVTAGPCSRDRVARIGAESVLDYHDADWPRRVVELTDGRGVDAAANVIRGGAARAMAAVRDGGRLATITSDPPDPARGIRVDSVYVRPDGPQLELACNALAAGQLPFTIGARFPLADAGAALARAIAGRGGAVVLELD